MEAVNFQSLNMVRDELVATIEQAAQNLEKFVILQDDSHSLQACVEGVAQIAGTLRLIQFSGAEQLAQEIFANAQEISPGNSGRLFEKRLEVISNSFFILTRYLEYVQQSEKQVPVLLIPQINELRKLRAEPSFPESHFFSVDLTAKLVPPVVEPIAYEKETFSKLVRRTRHMYQIGLLGLVRNKQFKNSIAMMRRALSRLQRLCVEGQSLSSLWWLANATLGMIDSQQMQMQMIETRKLLFSRLDRVIAQIERSGVAAIQANAPRGLLKELVYLMALADTESEAVKLVRDTFRLDRFPYSEAELLSEREGLHGPSAHTVSSLAQVLQDELSNTKKILESASQSSVQMIDDMDGFIATLQKVAEILNIVGLAAAGNTLKDEIQRIKKWQKQGESIELIEMQDVANTLLYLESTVSAIEHSKLSNEKIDMANKVAQREVVASGQLSEAKKIVVLESQSGLALTKRALSAFAESDFDTGHIKNISKTLNSVRGGMLLLKNYRAAAVLVSCIVFVEKVLLEETAPPALHEMLETYADAIISLEYYLNSASATMIMDESVLPVAEESLEALGYPVSTLHDGL
ncbi:MAG: CDP-diacylglycerol--glycerol-3-phosphate 3-phosphatidyltransferase [Alteromonadaceae bacterium]|nr:MAG: CDP-diacylglycerol--glycerol-3-phosphate 3-phosphatidyltransferase [Alteromonadaceae bacterium]